MTFAIIAGAVVYGGALAVRIGRLHKRVLQA